MRSAASFITALALGLCLAAPIATADAQGRGNGRGQAKGKADKPDKPANKPDKPAHKPAAKGKPQKAENKAEKKGGKDVDVVVVDRDGHARVIRNYRESGALPPGLAKRQALPPGLRQQLAERGELPPGLRTYLVDVPTPWASRLPTIPSYYHRYFVGDDLIVVDTRTDRIVAIVRDVLR